MSVRMMSVCAVLGLVMVAGGGPAVGAEPGGEGTIDSCLYGNMRWCWMHAYGSVVQERFYQFPLRAAITHVLIAAMPFTNPPERKEYDRLANITKQDIAFLHERGIRAFGYHPGTFLYGEPDAPAVKTEGHTGPLKSWFDFFETRWEQQYEEYFGKRPATDPMTYLQVTAEGKPMPYSYKGPAGYYFCANSPEYRTYARGIIDMMIDLGYDGCYLDSTGVWNRKGACYCEHCKERFREFLKETCSEEELRGILKVSDAAEVEPPVALSGDNAALWMKWQEFRAQASPDLLRMLQAHARKRDPDFAISCNYCMSWKDLLESFSGTYGPAMNYDLINEAQSFGLVEHPRRPTVVRGEPGSTEQKDYGGGTYITSDAYQYRYLKAVAGEKAVVMLEALEWWHTPRSPGHENITKAWFANAHANGLVPDVSYCYINDVSPLQQDAVALYNNFWKDHADLFVRSKMEANVGAWASTQQGYLNQPTMCFPAAQLLWEAGILFREVLDRDITAAGLKGVDALVVAHVPVVSEAQYMALKEFVEAGGRLVLFGEVGTYDEYGRKRPDAPLFVGGGDSGRPLQKAMGAGMVAYLPRGECPVGFSEGATRWMKTGIPEAEHEKTTYLRRIPAALRQVMKGPLTCEIANKPVTTEVTVMRSSGGQYVVQLVNFNIPLNPKGSAWWRDAEKAKQSALSDSFLTLLEEGTWGGKPNESAAALRGEWDPQVHPEKDLLVRLQVADEFAVRKVRLLSPDVEEMLADYKVVEAGGVKVVEFAVPQLDIYTVAVVE